MFRLKFPRYHTYNLRYRDMDVENFYRDLLSATQGRNPLQMRPTQESYSLHQESDDE